MVRSVVCVLCQRERNARQLVDEQAEEHVKVMQTRLVEINRHHQIANLAHQTQRVELELVTRELQLMKETNMALATEKLEQNKISQLELQLNGEENSEMDVKEKSPMVGSGVIPIGGPGKVVQADELIGLSNWLPPVQILEQAYKWDQELFFLLVNVQSNDVHFHTQVECIWKKAYTYRLENLSTEILVRGEVMVEDPLKAYWLLGDLAARVLLYQAEMEATQLERSQKEAAMAKTVRQIYGDT